MKVEDNATVGIPKLIDGLKMEDEISVSLPAWVWAVACVQLQDHAEDSSFIGAILVRAQEAVMHPAYLVARQIRHQQETEQQRKIQQAAARMVFQQFAGDDDDVAE